MRKMTKRERVEATVKFAETDRVPVYDLMVCDAAIEHFAGRPAPYGEEGVKVRCQAISRILDMTRSAAHGPAQPGEFTDDDGFVNFREDRWIGGGVRRRPFSDVPGARQWTCIAIDRYRKQVKEFDLKRYRREFCERRFTIQGYLGDGTVVLLRETGTGLDWIRYMLGLELFSYLYVDEPALISEFLDVFTELEVRIVHAIADPALSPVTLTYGDIACKGRLLHSPEFLRREFFPRLKRVNDAYHEHGITCLFHSDGYLMEVISDLIAAGCDGLNPIEVVAGMSLKEVRQKYGRQLFLAGGIDISQLMALGTPEDVRQVCQQAIADACPGYFMGSTTELDNGARLENILAMLEVAWTSGPVKVR